MKLQNILPLLVTLLLLSCGSTETVIADNGKIYEIKGNTFKNDGVDVTEQLTNQEKESIKAKLQEKIDVRKASEKRQQELKDQQKELEKTQEEAKKKQRELEKKQQELERIEKEKKDARDNYIKAKKELEDNKEKYERLKEKGKLSPRDEIDWAERFKNLEQKLNEAKQKMDALNS